MSLAKKALIAIAAIIAIKLLVAVIAYKLVDDSVIEAKALETLQNTLKRDVSVEGDFTLSRSLHPTLRTTGVRIASADWDAGNSLLQAKTIEFGIALVDLLRGVITIENIVFEDAIINIKRNTDGQSNLEFSPKQAPSSKKSDNTGGAPFDVIDVNIKNLTINYSDLQSETAFVYVLDQFSLIPKNKQIIKISASSKFEEQPIVIESTMCRIRHLLKGETCLISADVSTLPFETKINGSVNISQQGNVHLDVDTKAGNINELVLAKDLTLPDTESIKLKSQLSGNFKQLGLNNLDAAIALENTSVLATGKVASINELKGIDLSINASAEQPSWLDEYQEILASKHLRKFKTSALVQGDKKALSVNNIESTLAIQDTDISISGNAVVTPDLNIELDISADGKHPAWLDELQEAIVAKEIDKLSIKAHVISQGKAVNISQLESNITISESTTSAQGEININEEAEVKVDLSVQSKGKNLRDFEKVIKQTLPESGKFSLDTIFNFHNNNISLNKLTLVIDETKLNGSSEIELTSPPNIKAELIADTLNVEHLLAIGADGSTESKDEKQESKEKSSLFSDQPIQLEWLNSADTDIALTINNLLYKDATLKDVKASVVAKNNIATLDITSLKYKDASLVTKTSIDANKHSYSYDLFTENFDLGSLLNETELSSTLNGKIDASIDLNSSGKTSKQLAHNAMGKFTTVMTEGSLADAPIDLLASNLLVELMPGKSKKDNTKIECLFIQFSGENGIFNSDAALLNTENIVMTSNGSIDLTNEKLNLLLVPKPKNIELFTLDANIRVSGDITDPGFSLDKGSVFKKLLKSAATVALGPAALAVPFATMGGSKSEKCFSEVASVTTKAVEAQQEAERLAREQAEKEALEKELQEKTAKDAVVEPLDPENI